MVNTNQALHRASESEYHERERVLAVAEAERDHAERVAPVELRPTLPDELRQQAAIAQSDVDTLTDLIQRVLHCQESLGWFQVVNIPTCGQWCLDESARMRERLGTLLTEATQRRSIALRRLSAALSESTKYEPENQA